MLELIAVLKVPALRAAPLLRVRCSECRCAYTLKAWLSHLRRVERCSVCANGRRRGPHYGISNRERMALRRVAKATDGT